MRILGFDLARGVAILVMVIGHTLGIFSIPRVVFSPAGLAVAVVGLTLGAPVFTFLMGASLAFSKRATLKTGVIRGVTLLLLAYLLNFLRGTFPALLMPRFLGMRLDSIAPHTPASLFWTVDILHFAGLAVIVLTFIRSIVRKPTIWVMLAVAAAVSAPILWDRKSGWPPLDWLLTLVWGPAAFPLFPWVSYPLVGMALGFWLVSSIDRNLLFRRTAGAGLMLLLLGTVIILTNPRFHLGDYFHSGPGGVVGMMGLVLTWVAVCQWLVQRVQANPLFKLLYFWSARVTTMYCAHWIIIGWGVTIFGYHKQEWPAILLLMIAVLALADQATRVWGRLTRVSPHPAG